MEMWQSDSVTTALARLHSPCSGGVLATRLFRGTEAAFVPHTCSHLVALCPSKWPLPRAAVGVFTSMLSRAMSLRPPPCRPSGKTAVPTQILSEGSTLQKSDAASAPSSGRSPKGTDGLHSTRGAQPWGSPALKDPEGRVWERPGGPQRLPGGFCGRALAEKNGFGDTWPTNQDVQETRGGGEAQN